MPELHASTSPKLPSLSNPTVIPTENLLEPGILHVFLVRSPRFAFPSFAELITSPVIGDGFFNTQELSVHEMRSLFEFISSEGLCQPLIIESDDLVAYPEQVVPYLCGIAGIQFNRSMLVWQAHESQASRTFASEVSGKGKGERKLHLCRCVVSRC